MHPKKDNFGITDLALLCIADKTNVERAVKFRATDEVVQQCLQLLCVCMLKKPGIDRMCLDGVDAILLLKTQNIAKSRSCFFTDVLCMKVLAIAITCSYNVRPSLLPALLSVGMSTKGMNDGTQVKVPAKEVENPVYIKGLRTANKFFYRFRKALLRIVLKQCMSQMLRSGRDMDEDDTKQMKRQSFVPAHPTDVPPELSSADADEVSSSGPFFPCTSYCLHNSTA